MALLVSCPAELEQKGRLEGETSLFIVGSRNAVSHTQTLGVLPSLVYCFTFQGKTTMILRFLER